MNPEAIRILFGYAAWAGERLWPLILSLSPEQFTRELSYSRGSIRNQVVHVMSAERRWMQRLQPAELSPHLRFEAYPTPEAAHRQWQATQTEVLGYVGSLGQAELDEVVPATLPDRGLSFALPRWQVLLHVANHATDHRAQILATLNEHFGLPTEEQDLLFYLVGAK